MTNNLRSLGEWRLFLLGCATIIFDLLERDNEHSPFYSSSTIQNIILPCRVEPPSSLYLLDRWWGAFFDTLAKDVRVESCRLHSWFFWVRMLALSEFQFPQLSWKKFSKFFLTLSLLRIPKSFRPINTSGVIIPDDRSMPQLYGMRELNTTRKLPNFAVPTKVSTTLFCTRFRKKRCLFPCKVEDGQISIHWGKHVVEEVVMLQTMVFCSRLMKY